jgi:acyl-ACP thioesterase
MTEQHTWQESIRIHTFQMDPKGEAHLTTICNYLQEAASMHAQMAGLGFDAMVKRNQVWVLTRLKIEIDSYPVWNDRLTLTTWSRGNEGIFYLRDFYVVNEAGRKTIKATSSWAALNLKTRRPELVEGLEEKLFSQRAQIALDERLEKLPEIRDSKLVKQYQIQYTDIDIVYHVNNVKYIEIIMNAFPLSIHKEKKVKTLEVNYLGEANYGDEVQVLSQSISENEYLVSIVKSPDKKEVCKARLIWE